MDLIQQGYSLETEVIFNIRLSCASVSSVPYSLRDMNIMEADLRNYTDWDMFEEEVLDAKFEYWILEEAIKGGHIDVLSSKNKESDKGN